MIYFVLVVGSTAILTIMAFTLYQTFFAKANTLSQRLEKKIPNRALARTVSTVLILVYFVIPWLPYFILQDKKGDLNLLAWAAENLDVLQTAGYYILRYFLLMFLIFWLVRLIYEFIKAKQNK